MDLGFRLFDMRNSSHRFPAAQLYQPSVKLCEQAVFTEAVIAR